MKKSLLYFSEKFYKPFVIGLIFGLIIISIFWFKGDFIFGIIAESTLGWIFVISLVFV